MGRNRGVIDEKRMPEAGAAIAHDRAKSASGGPVREQRPVSHVARTATALARVDLL